ncbi:MAG TPA: alpha-hydroxy acid oxidase [Acetobacteraceae bacterium]|jgi:glycolate oxidase|nr:alpha-hydroxy acid oxidase [Acetobacteraceae bacterium]
MADEAGAVGAAAGDVLTLHEFITAARRRLDRNIWDYLVGGTETETTLRRNRLALDSIAFRPRVLADVSRIDAGGAFLGRSVPMPVALAPVGSLESFEPGGGATVAVAAARAGVPLFVSSVTAPGLEATAQAADGPKVFQLYVRGGDDFVDEHVRRAVDAGYMAFCITVDTALYSRRERDIAKRFAKTWRDRHAGMEFQAAFDWSKAARFRDRHHDVPLILKGIATAEDAARACELGVAAVYVSNHGGRQLDHGRGALDVLPEVVEAVAGRARIIIDGGFSRGTDIVKAIVLGADTVAVGRLYLYGLAGYGAAGVARVLEILQGEIETTLGLLGVESFAQLDRSYLYPAPPVWPTHVHSAFPLLAEDY